jgi:hypothetical protein
LHVRTVVPTMLYQLTWTAAIHGKARRSIL